MSNAPAPHLSLVVNEAMLDGVVATVLSAVIGFVFIGIVTVLARSSLPPPPRSKTRTSVDKAIARGYNEPDSHSGGNK